MMNTVQINESTNIKYVQERLQLWSEYILCSRDNGHAWPSQVAWVGMMIRSSAFQSVTLIPVTYDEFKEIDDFVNRLPQMLKNIIVMEWCEKGTQEQKSARASVSRETFRNRLKWAYLELLRLGL